MSEVADVLGALADLAPGDTVADHLIDVTREDLPFLWMGDDVSPVQLFSGETDRDRVTLPWRYEDDRIKRLRAFDALHKEERVLRAGWLMLCGPARTGATVRRVCLPLVQRSVRIDRWVMQGSIELLSESELVLPHVPGNDIDLPFFGEQPLPPAPPETWSSRLAGGTFRVPLPRWTAAELAADKEFRQWIRAAVAAGGLQPVAHIVADVDDLAAVRDGPDLTVVVGSALFVTQAPARTTNAASIAAWLERDGIERSAFAQVYGLATPSGRDDADGDASDDHLLDPLPLTEAQRDAIESARSAPVTVVSGAPGNGKSHLVCAAAIDAVAHGRSVLVVTPTPYAADVLGELLGRQPGPVPVQFGESEGRRRMIATLEAMAEQTLSDDDLEHRRDRLGAIRRERVNAEAAVIGALEREERAARVARWAIRLPDLRSAAPGILAADADLEGIGRRVDALRERSSWWRRRRLRKVAGARSSARVDTLLDAFEAATDIQAELELGLVGGTSIGSAWDVLLATEAAERVAEGQLIDGMVRSSSRWKGGGRRAVAALVSALPAGRATRRDRLGAIDADALVRALPLWVGTLRDADDLLPATAGLFDLVIVDEAAQVDQFRAAGALLRAKRAVVVGDPRQLRHVSFVADVDVAATLERHGVASLADRLDVRRQSLFDVAAGAAPVTFLDEHFRSVPHLIEFSAKRFYGGRVKVATRNPVNETEDVIDVVPAPDVAGEIDIVVDLVAALVAAGQVGIGAITPFRSHADAIEAALLARFEPAVIEGHGLRTGTAHTAQGSERDHLIVALGLSEDDPAARWRFAEDPNLFNVLVTRGRRRVTVVTALTVGEVRRGIVADYLRHASSPPAPPTTSSAPGSWIAALAGELERNGVPVRVGYPVGRWSVDICAGTGPEAVALDCTVHPEGPAAHIDRHRSLRRAGWRVVDAFASRWDGDAAAAAVELRGALQ